MLRSAAEQRSSYIQGNVNEKRRADRRRDEKSKMIGDRLCQNSLGNEAGPDGKSVLYSQPRCPNNSALAPRL